MGDEELAAELCPDDPAIGLKIVRAMTPEKRQGYERLIEVGRELQLYSAGLGPAPKGVIINRGRSRFYAKDRTSKGRSLTHPTNTGEEDTGHG